MLIISELVISVLACSRIGAIHSVVFGRFSAATLDGKMQDDQAKILLTADGLFTDPRPSAETNHRRGFD
ncbi:MAG: hypothetical protein ACMUEL_07025 [Flavobacteriales bacterium Tduv]